MTLASRRQGSGDRSAASDAADQELTPVLDADSNGGDGGAKEEDERKKCWQEKLRSGLVISLLFTVKVLTSFSYSILASFFPLQVILY